MKIRIPRPLVGLALVSLVGVSAFAQVQDGPPVDLKALIKALKEVKSVATSKSKDFAVKVIQDFKNAGASNNTAVAFYQNALMATKNQSLSDVQNLGKEEAIQNAARIHLNYLVLTIQRSMGATTQQLEPALTAHIAAVAQAGAGDAAVWMRRERARKLSEQGNVSANPNKGRMAADKEPMFWEQKLITGSVKDSVFLQWYNIQNMIADVKDWEAAPGNVDGIYQSTLLPYYRQIKDQRVLAYWDQKIKDEGVKATNSASPFKIDLYNRFQRPQLLWNRAKDEVVIGLRNRGIADMAEIIRTFPDHPDATAWIGQLEAMLPGAKPDASATTAPAAPGSAAQPTPAQPAPEQPAPEQPAPLPAQ